MKGKYYKSGKRTIAIIGDAVSHAFGDVYVVEELQAGGYALSVADKKQMETIAGTWTEIGKAEWTRDLRKDGKNGC